MRALRLIALKVIGEFGRGVGVAAAPGLVVDDLALEAIIVVDVGDERIQSIELCFGVIAFGVVQHDVLLVPGSLGPMVEAFAEIFRDSDIGDGG